MRIRGGGDPKCCVVNITGPSGGGGEKGREGGEEKERYLCYKSKSNMKGGGKGERENLLWYHCYIRNIGLGTLNPEERRLGKRGREGYVLIREGGKRKDKENWQRIYITRCKRKLGGRREEGS